MTRHPPRTSDDVTVHVAPGSPGETSPDAGAAAIQQPRDNDSPPASQRASRKKRQVKRYLPPGVVLRSDRAATVAKWFGLGAPRHGSVDGSQETNHAPPVETDPPLPSESTITLVTGPSGSGKSSWLRALVESHRERINWLDVAAIQPREVPLVDCFDGRPLGDVLGLLSRVGLGEAWSYLKTPSELSDGQRWRLRLALALHRAGATDGRTVLVADEFAALLDRVTASVVARALRKVIDGAVGLSAVVATGHEDLLAALRPDVVVRCDFGRTTVEAPRRYHPGVRTVASMRPGRAAI